MTYREYLKKERERANSDEQVTRDYFERANIYLDKASSLEGSPSYQWANDNARIYADSINNLTKDTERVNNYIESLKGTEQYEPLKKQFGEYNTALTKTKDYLNGLYGLASQYDNEDDYNSAMTEINRQQKYKDYSYDDLIKASNESEDEDEAEWLKSYANDKVSLKEIKGKRDKVIARQNEVNAQINEYMDKERAAFSTEEKQKYAALLDPLYKESDELKKQLIDYNPVYEQKQTQANAAEWETKYKGLNYGELLSEIRDEKSTAEKKWLQDKADEVATSEDYQSKLDELKARQEAEHSNWGGSNEYSGEITELENKLKLKQRAEKAAEYETLVNSPDFADNNSMEWNHIGANDMLTYMNDEEKQVYSYLHNTGREDEAEEYSKLIQPRLTERYTQTVNEWAQQYATEHPWLASGLSLGSNLISGAGIVEDIGKRIVGEPIDVNSPMHYGANMTNALRSTVSDKYLGDVGTFGYDTVMSAADSAINMAVSTAIGGAVGAVGSMSTAAVESLTATVSSTIMGSQVATNTVIDAKERGLSDDQAVTLGVLYGVVEGLSEKWSIERFIHDPTSIGSALRKAAIAEGTEEIAANWGDRIVDALVTGDKNKVSEQYQNYIKQGFSDKEALTMTLYNMVGEDASAFLAGGLSGVAMSGTHMALAGGVNKAQEIKFDHDVANEIRDNKEGLDKLVKDAKALGEDSDGFKLAEQVEKKIEKGEKVKLKEVNRLLDYVDENNAQKEKEQLESITKNLSDEQKGFVVYIADKLDKSQTLTNKENELIHGNKDILNAIAYLRNENAEETLELMDATKYKSNLKYYKSNGNGLIEVDGNEYKGTVEIKSTDPKSGHMELRLTSPDNTVKIVNTRDTDIDFRSDAERTLFAAASTYKNVDEANALVENYEGGDVDSYLNDWNLFSNYGRLGYNRDQIAQRINENADTPARRAAYYYGMESFKSSAQSKYIVDKAFEAKTEGYTYQKGSFTNNISQKAKLNLNKSQRQFIGFGKLLSRITPVNVEIFESKINDKGSFEGEQGSYNRATKTLRIDVNAGYQNSTQAIENAVRHGMFLTAGHELTHVAEQGKSYMKVRAEIVRTLDSAGFNYKELVDKKVNELRHNEKYKGIGTDELYRLADTEALADCCETMLQNSKLLEKLATEDYNLAEKLINAIKKAIESLRNFFKENPLEAKTEYGQALLEAMNKVENRVQELWDKAVAEGIRAENQESGGVKNDNRNSSSSFNEYSVSSAIWEALDHADKHHDNLIKIGQMPRYIQSLLGISGEFYVQRNHTYENTVKKEQAISEGRYDEHAHYHGFGVDKMTNAIMSIEHPVMTINDTKDNENPTVVMILDVKGNNDTPIYAAFSFYTNRPINGKFNVKPHIVLTIAEREWFEGEGRDKSYEEIIRDAIKYKKVIDFDAKKRNELSVIAGNVNLGNITPSFLNDNLSQFKKEINIFKEKNKINYSDRFNDADYLSAVERGDMKTAQQMVDEAAKAAGYDMHLYHGAKSGGGFTVFKDWQYFTADKKYAEKYTQRNTESNSLYEVFVKSNRMFDTRNADDQAVFVQYRSEYGMSELQESGLPDWTDGYDLSEIIEENNLDYDGIILDEGVQYYPNAKEYDERYRRVLSYVIRKSNQVKSADPVTYDDDGNVIPLSERFNEDKEDIRYSDRVIEENRDLVAVHNLSQEKLLKSLKLGGLAMPSIAVTNSEHTGFGDISLIFGKDTINPDVNRDNKVYSGDAWTPMFPNVEYEADPIKSKKLYERAREAVKDGEIEFFNPVSLHPDNIEDRLNRSKGEEQLKADLKRDYGFKNFYLKETTGESVKLKQKETKSVLSKDDIEEYSFLYEQMPQAFDKLESMSGKEWLSKYGDTFRTARENYIKQFFPDISQDALDNAIGYEKGFRIVQRARNILNYHKNGAETVTVSDDYEGTRAEIDNKVDEKAYSEWINELFDGIEKNSGIQNGVDPYYSNGNSRSFSATHYEVTLENIVKAMKAQRNGENSFAGTGIFGVAAKSYGTFGSMKADTDRLKSLTDEEYEGIKESFGKRFSEIAGYIAENGKQLSDNQFINMEICFENILDGVRESKTKSGLVRYLKKYYGDVIDDSVATDILDLIADVGKMPTRYFEAKPQRAVGFDEVMAAVVPSNASDEVKTALQEAGVTIYEYEHGNDKSRAEAMQSAIDTEYVDNSGQKYDNLKFQDRTDLDYFDELFDMGEDLFEDESKRQTLNELIDKYPDDALSIIKHAAEQTIENVLTKTKSIKLSDKAYLSIAQKFMQDYNISRAANPGEDAYLVSKLKNIVARVEAGELTTGEDVVNEIIEVARDALMLGGTLDDSMKEERDFVLGLLKGKTLIVTDYNESDIRENYGDLKRYRAKLGHGYIALERNAKKKLGGVQGVYINEIITEVQQAYPSLINDEADEATGFSWLERLMNDKLEPTFKADTTSTPEIDAVNAGFEIIENLLDRKARQIVNAKGGQKYVLLGNSAKEMAQEQRKAIREAVSKAKEKERQKSKEALKQQRDKFNEKIREVKTTERAKAKEAVDKQRQKTREVRQNKNKLIIAEKQLRMNEKRQIRNNYERRGYITRIKKYANDFKKIALGKSVPLPQEFSDGFYNVAMDITEAIKLSDNTAIGEKLSKTVELMRNLAEDKIFGDTYATELTETFRSQVAEFAEAIKNKKIDRNLTVEEAENICNILLAIKETVRNANRILAINEGQTVKELGLSIMAEQNGLNVGKLKKNFVNFGKYFMTSQRLGYLFNGYDDNAALVKLMDSINIGQRRKNMFYMTANKMFDDYRDEHVKELDNTEKNVRSIHWKDNSGTDRTTDMTGMQAMQIVMTWNREAADENLVHITKGGLTISNPEQLAKGNYKKAIENSTRIIGINNSFITAVASSLTDFEKGYIDIAERFFNELATDAVNETSLKLHHIKIANSRYYIPIKVDQDSLVKEIEGVKHDSSIEAMGMLKAVTPKSSKPIYIYGLDNVINGHISDVSNYYGLAVPIRDLNKVLNVQDNQYDESGDLISSDSVKNALNKNWGKQAIGMYETMLTDLQNSRAPKGEKYSEGLNNLIRTIRSNFVTSTLNANKSVMLKQAASYTTAGAYLSGGSLTAGLKDFALYNTTKGYKRLLEEIDSHTAQHYIRRKGLSSNEIADISQNWINRMLSNSKAGRVLSTSELAQKIPKGVNPNNWIQEMDCLTTAALWCATKAEVNKQFNKAKKEIDTAEYWQAVTDLYDKVIEDTQPMYDPLHRPEVLKTSNEFWKSIFMFHTQPLQNAGIIFDALGRVTTNAKDKAAWKTLGKALASQTSSLIVYSLMSLAVAFIMHRMKRYRDKDNELTAQSVMDRVFQDMIISGSGVLLPFGGSEVFGAIFDGNEIVQDNVAQTVTNYIESGHKLVTTIGEYFEKKNKAKEMQLEFHSDPSEILTALKNFATLTAQDLFGIPVNNVIKNINGYVDWIKDLTDGDGQLFAPEEQTKKQIAGSYVKRLESGNSAEAQQALTDLYNQELETAKADPSVKNPEAKAQGAVREMLVDAYQTEYQEAFLRNDDKEMRRIAQIFISAKKYMTWNNGKTSLDNKLEEWRKTAKETIQKKY